MERLFVALPLSESSMDAIESYAVRLQEQGVQGRFVSRQNYHLTLAFIGESDQREQIEAALRSLAFDPVEIRIDGTLRFGSVLALAVENNPALVSLSEQVRSLLGQAGIAFDHKTFKAHITLARKVRMENALPPFILEEKIGEVVLYSSAFVDGKRLYTPLQVIRAV